MSGHSKWSTIKRKKEAKDISKGKVFSRLLKAISVAANLGGSPDPNENFRLRVAVDAAKAANMPKENIDRVLKQSQEKLKNLEEVTYEGFGPSGVGILVEAATDNRNRTGQEVRGIFERNGGIFAGPGSVAHGFESKGLILLESREDVDQDMLVLIDLGVEDVSLVGKKLEVLVEFSETKKVADKIEEIGFKIAKIELIKKPLVTVELSSRDYEKLENLLEAIEDLDDVENVFHNAVEVK